MKISKKIIIPVIVCLVLAGSFFGARLLRTSTAVVDVTPVSAISMDWLNEDTALDGIVYD